MQRNRFEALCRRRRKLSAPAGRVERSDERWLKERIKERVARNLKETVVVKAKAIVRERGDDEQRMGGIRNDVSNQC